MYLYTDNNLSVFAVPPCLKVSPFPESISQIGNYAFSGYQEETIPNFTNIRKLGSFAFERSKIKGRVTINESLLIESTSFTECYGIVGFDIYMLNEHYIERGPIIYNSKLDEIICVAPGSTTTIDFEKSVRTIKPFAFYHCSTKSDVQIPSGITCIGESAFEGANISNNIDLSSVTEIGKGAFANAPNLKINRPPPAEIISEEAFMNTGVTDFTSISKNTRVIGKRAFAGSKIVSISIPDSVAQIQSQAFIDNPGINAIVCHDLTVAADAFIGTEGTANITDDYLGDTFGGLEVFRGDCAIQEEAPRRTPYPSPTSLPLPQHLSMGAVGGTAIGLGVGGCGGFDGCHLCSRS